MRLWEQAIKIRLAVGHSGDINRSGRRSSYPANTRVSVGVHALVSGAPKSADPQSTLALLVGGDAQVVTRRGILPEAALGNPLIRLKVTQFLVNHPLEAKNLAYDFLASKHFGGSTSV